MTARSLTGRPHPLNGWIKAVTLGQDHAGLNATLLETGERPSRLLLIWRSAGSHWPWEGSELRMAVSEDLGASFQQERGIFLDPDWDTRNFAAARMADGRLGILCTRFRIRRGPGHGIEVHAPLFLFSDNHGETWHARDLPPPAREGAHVNFHGDILHWPAEAGGGDNGFAAFSYSTPHKVLDGLYTRDNGDSWDWRMDICQAAAHAPHPNEMWAARLGTRTRWMMVARPVTSGSTGNATVLFSDNLTDWDGPHDSGLLLSGNAPALLVEDDTAYLYTVSRRDRARELPADGEVARGNRMVVAEAPIGPLLDSGGRWDAFGGWREVTTLPEAAVGYVFPRKVEGRWMAIVNCGETPPIGTRDNKRTFLALVTPQAPVIVDAPSWRAGAPQENLLDNGGFALWGRGRRFDLRAPAMTAERWRVDLPEGDRVRVEARRLPHPEGAPRDMLVKRGQAPSGSGVHRTVQRLPGVGTGAGERVTVMLRAAMAGGGRLSAIRLRQEFGTGGDDPVETTLAEDVALTDAPLFRSFVGALPGIEGKRIGPDNALELVLEERAGGDPTPFEVTYADVALILWPVAAPLLRRSPEEEARRCARFFQQAQVPADTLDPAGFHEARLTPVRMAGPPALRFGLPDGVIEALPERLDAEGVRIGLRTVAGAPAPVLELTLDAEPLPAPSATARPAWTSAPVLCAGQGAATLWLAEGSRPLQNLRRGSKPLRPRPLSADRLRLQQIERALMEALLSGTDPPEQLQAERRALLEWGEPLEVDRQNPIA